MKGHRAVWWVVGTLLVGACSGAAADSSDVVADAAAVAAPLSQGSCEGTFVPHDLDHVTRGPSVTTTMFDGTGSGVAVADLDGDGDLDIVLGNLSGTTHVFWNQGRLRFERTELISGRFRQVAAVDEDGDGRSDIVLSTGIGTPVLLRNTGAGFERVPFDVTTLAYSMAWGDLGGDGDLDLVTGSYNAELTADREFAPQLGGRSGVFLHERTADGYAPTQLASNAQALAILLEDLDADGATDILVGNDLLTPDAAWSHDGGAWTPMFVFDETTFSTMSLDAADVDNDGDVDVLATDMHPMTDDAATRAAWEPIMEDMEAQPVPEGDPQIMANVLQVADDGYENRAADLGIEWTGWSWSGLFGDLDNDGFQDVYVVNGMTADSLFPDLPDHDLVEPNQAFRNVGGTAMEPAPEWGLASTEGGRGMAQADFDGDGDLDVVINNLNAPSRIFENRLCGGAGVTVDLEWSGTGNRSAVGAVVTAEADGATLTRSVKAARGYLSGGPLRVHFGVGDADSVDLRVRWPDGATSEAGTVAAGSHVVITRPPGS